MSETNISQSAHDAAQRMVRSSADTSDGWQQRWAGLQRSATPLFALIAAAPDVHHAPVTGALAKDAWNWLKENPRTIRNAILQIEENIKSLGELPRVQAGSAGTLPRVVALSQGLLAALDNEWSEAAFAEYLNAFQRTMPLQSREVWAVPAALKMAILEVLIPAATRLLQSAASDADVRNVPRLMMGLQSLGVAAFPRLLEPLLPVESVLRQDPGYAGMDAPSRDRYRNVIAHLAKRANFDELQIAHAAIALVRAAEVENRNSRNPRVVTRRSHVGYFLTAEGRPRLLDRIGYHPTREERLREWIASYAADVYITGVWLITLLLITLLMVPLLGYTDVVPALVLAFLLTLLPASQGAVETMNHAVSALFPAHALPKFDFSGGIPDDCATLVTIPTLLFSEKQTRELVDALEVRYLANTDRNLHFALVTDLPDSVEQPGERDVNALVNLASNLIGDLNSRYDNQSGQRSGGSFFLLHRHRIYSARQGVWMGWERKRGKLLDLNRLLRNEYDSFPIKQGPAEMLATIRYVLTLDSDTDLPRGSAREMIATMAHPLNQAIVDPASRLVTQGYGILQPRVGISVNSASRSRLARLYSGETGLDIYSRAVSDIYQDMFGEAIFTGKGLYEVDTLRTVLEHRFPHNALLSHDLIEGAYARVGLVSDVEVIDDYPSHLSAWSRRKHRWVRGDWQITQWLFPRVPNESNQQVPNPISMLSRWKIFDNLRRSLVEPGTFFLLVAGWLRLPGGPFYWTAATLSLLFLPVYIQLFASLLRIAIRPTRGAMRDTLEAFFASHVTVLLGIAFLPHQALLSLDAIFRTMVRRFVTGKRLLEWETAAEAEQGVKRRTPVELYLELMPFIAVVLGILISVVNRRSLPFALPFLVVWAAERGLTWWLNRPPLPSAPPLSTKDTAYLRRVALLTWRYFSEFSTAEHHWLIPDNVEEKDLHIAARVSPTNLGLLLNSRQVASNLGFLTMPQFADLTDRSLHSLEEMEKFHGHLMNWYDTTSLQALAPRNVSTVDNGNLFASLLTLAHGTEAMLNQPLLPRNLRDGLIEYARESHDPGVDARPPAGPDWVADLLQRAAVPSAEDKPRSDEWLDETFAAQKAAILDLVEHYLPWLLAENGGLARTLCPDLLETDSLTLARLPHLLEQFDLKLQQHWGGSAENDPALLRIEPLRLRVAGARGRIGDLLGKLKAIARRAHSLADAMDFSILLHPTRRLLSIAYNIELDRIEDACYDLLASEARTAAFLAIAKGDIPQEVWFQLGRAHVLDESQPLLVSWTGTMFEYLMPNLWMRSSRDSMLDRTQQAAVQAQRRYTARKRIPWGISEAGYATPGDDGHYQYHAFGLPPLAVSPGALDGGPVIAPYATCLALPVDTRGALQNLRSMEGRGWLTPRGFYESADYSDAGRQQGQPTLVRSWMAHHQGMTLLALLNVLHNDVVKDWFHADKRVQATALLLQERPMRTSALTILHQETAHTKPVTESA